MLVEMNPSGGGGGTEITPSNSSPVALTNGETYTTNGNGYAIQSYTSKTPSSSPSSVSSGDIVKMGGSGYLINSYSSVTPSSSGTYFSAGMKNMASSGYAYSSRPSANVKTGSFTGIAAAGTYTIQVGFTPKLVFIYDATNNQGSKNKSAFWASDGMPTDKYIGLYGSGSGGAGVGNLTISSMTATVSYGAKIASVSSNSVQFQTGTNTAWNYSSITWEYIIIG